MSAIPLTYDEIKDILINDHKIYYKLLSDMAKKEGNYISTNDDYKAKYKELKSKYYDLTERFALWYEAEDVINDARILMKKEKMTPNDLIEYVHGYFRDDWDYDYDNEKDEYYDYDYDNVKDVVNNDGSNNVDTNDEDEDETMRAIIAAINEINDEV